MASAVPGRAQTIENEADGTANGVALDLAGARVTLTRLSSVASDAVAEISPNEVTVGSIDVAFTYDVRPTLAAGDTGPAQVDITAPTGYSNLRVTDVLVDGSPLAANCAAPGAGEYCVISAGQTLTVTFGSRVTADQARITVRFLADAPSAPGSADFAAVLSDGPLTLAVRAGDANGDATDANSVSVEVFESQGVVLSLAKSADRSEAVVGEPVVYVTEIRNLADSVATDVRLEDTLPPNFKYVKGSARLNGASIPDPAGERPLVFAIGTVPGRVDDNGNGTADPGEDGYLALSYQVTVGAGARPGEYRSSVVAKDMDPCDVCVISNVADVEVDVRTDELLDLGLVIGKVFEDHDRDGWQSSDEPGVANAVVALDDGAYAITDEHGRYHLPAVTPGQRLVKLDLAGLGGGAVATTGVSRVLTLTPGISAKADFGVELPRDPEAIGTPARPGVALEGMSEDPPVLVLGSAETLSVLVNGDQIRLPSGNVRLTVGDFEDVLYVTDEGLVDPVRFTFEVDFRRHVERWTLNVMNSRDAVVHSIGGGGDLPHALSWDGRTSDGRLVTVGEVYHYRLEVETHDGIHWASPRRLFAVNRRSFISMRLTGDAFQSNAAVLSPLARRTLRDAGDVLRRFPDEKVVIEGHTDSFGSAEHNLDLSRRRAEAAKSFFTEEMGLSSERFTLRWFGEERPVASEREPGGAALNRRVVIRADMEEVERTNVTDGFWSEPKVEVNGKSVPVGESGRFSANLDGSKTDEVVVVVATPEGRTAAGVRLPELEVLEPLGEHRVPFGEARGGLSVSARDEDGDFLATASVVGRTGPGGSVELGGQPVPTEPDGSFATVVELSIGHNPFGIVARSPEGFRRIVNLDVHVADQDENGEIIIDADVIPNLTVYWPPSDEPLRTTKLRLTGDTDPENEIRVNGAPWGVGADGSFGGLVEMPVGANRIEVVVTDPSGRQGTIERAYEVAENQLFLVAIADGVVGQLHGEGYLEGAGLEEMDEFYTTGRVSYYLRGTVLGKYLVKSAFDSGPRDIEPIFGDLDEVQADRLLTNLDPDKFYPVYGDESTVGWDAETLGRFYLAVDAADWNVLVGNYPITLTDTELAQYQRTLYGGKAVYQRASRDEDGPPDTAVLLFGAELEQVRVRDEVRATGGSLYFLSHPDVIEGSEQITIVVRDKITGLERSRRIQRRNSDYSIKYEEGRVLFHRPISSVDLDDMVVDPDIISGNPVSIQVDYETFADSFEETAAGVRVKQRVGSRVTVGGTYIDDHAQAGPYELAGVDAEVRSHGSRLVGEYAQSDGAEALMFQSDDGGLSYHRNEAGTALDGSAWRAAAELDLSRLWGEEGRLRVKGYHRDLEPGFLATGSFLERGLRRSGASASFRLSEAHRLMVSHDREDRTGEVEAAGALDEVVTTTAQWNWRRSRWGLNVEYYANEAKEALGATIAESQLAAAEAVAHLGTDLTGRVQYQQTLSGDENDQITVGAEYQAHRSLALEARGTTGSIGSSAQAGVVLTTGDTRVYLTERLLRDDAGHETATVVGAESDLGPATKVYTEYQRASASAGDRNVSLVGVSRQLLPTEDITLLLGGEHSRIDSEHAGEADRKRSAVSGRLSYDGGGGLTAMTRNELRLEEGASRRRQFLTSNHLDVKVSPDYTVLGKYRFSRTIDRDTEAEEARLEEASVGVAYRPVKRNRINGMTRYTYLRDRRPTLVPGEEPTRRKLNVFSLDAIVDVHRRIEWVTKAAARIREERNGDRPWLTTHTYLTIQRLNGNVWGPVDLGLEYRILMQRKADDREQGWLGDLMWNLHEHFRFGGGFNFTDFSDNEFTMNDYSVRGWFLRAQGRY